MTVDKVNILERPFATITRIRIGLIIMDYKELTKGESKMKNTIVRCLEELVVTQFGRDK